jgi:hypothetical protein
VTIRVVTPAGGAASVTVPAPGDPYSTLTTFTAGQVLDVTPGGPWEGAIGTGNLTALSGPVQADELEGEGGEGTDNG